jgi:hypothetical protein
MNRYSGLLFLLCGVAMLQHINCTAPDIAGGSSSTDNGKVIGMVQSENGQPAPGTQVTLRTSDYDPHRDTALPQIDTTDSAGRYEFDSLAVGVYTIQAVGIGSRTRALVNYVMVDTSLTRASAATLGKPGELRVVVAGCTTATCYVYVPGTSMYAEVRDGVGVLDSVPAGFIPAVYYADAVNPAVIRSVSAGVVLRAGDTRTIADYSSWSRSARIVLNTTAAGAGVMENVVNFPVLIRVSKESFNFGEAKSDGADIRFKKPDDTPLPYEIERWDAAAGLAEIWVRVDTVYGNDSTHYFTMYWGNGTATPESDGGAVFDTVKGFQGVWHLSEGGIATARDATKNRYDGTPFGMTGASSVPGAIGAARDFDGSSSYIAMTGTADGKLDFPENGSYTMSLWAYADTIDTLWHAIAGKGHEQYYMQFKCFKGNRATWEFVEFHEQLGWEYTEDSTPPAPSSGEWVYITGVRSGTVQRLYINGKEVVDSTSLMPGEHPRNTADDFTVGRYGHSVTIPYRQGWSYFNGKVDEVRVSSTAVSAGWIRLCYMNQKAGNTLVMVRR